MKSEIIAEIVINGLTMDQITIGIAFLAGIVSFLSPCVLPLMPGFLAYLAGSSVQEEKVNRWEVFLNSVFFVLGFSVIFSLVGVLLQTVLEASSFVVQVWLARIGGLIIIFFGIYLMGIISIPFLEQKHALEPKFKLGSRYLTSFVFGAAFAVGWTPCVGPVLGGILGLAAAAPGAAFGLFLAYSLGLGLPFLLMGAFVSKARGVISKYGKWLPAVKGVFGALLVVIGILAFTQQLDKVANFQLLTDWVADLQDSIIESFN